MYRSRGRGARCSARMREHARRERREAEQPEAEPAAEFTVQAGRHIYRHRKPFVYVGKAEGTSPTEADYTARLIVSLLNAHIETARG